MANMIKLLVVLIIIGLVGLGLLVCGVVGYVAWPHLGVILMVIVTAVIGVGLAEAVIKKIRKAQGIDDHVYSDEEKKR